RVAGERRAGLHPLPGLLVRLDLGFGPALQELRELVDDDAAVGDLGLAVVVDEQARHLLLGLAVAPAEQADEVGGGDAAVAPAQVAEDLALVGELVALGARRAEDEVEDRVDELLLRALEAAPVRRRLDGPAPRVALVAVAAAVTPVGQEEPPEPADTPPPVAAPPPAP